MPVAPNLDDGRLPLDAGRKPIDVPQRFATSYANKSPMTVSSVEFDLIVPTNALTVVITASGADLRVATGIGGTAATGTYDIVYNGSSKSYPVALLGALYLLRNASTNVTVTFAFYQTGW